MEIIKFHTSPFLPLTMSAFMAVGLIFLFLPYLSMFTYSPKVKSPLLLMYTALPLLLLVPQLENDELFSASELSLLVKLLTYPCLMTFVVTTRPEGGTPLGRYDVPIVLFLILPVVLTEISSDILPDMWISLHESYPRISLIRVLVLDSAILMFVVLWKFDGISPTHALLDWRNYALTLLCILLSAGTTYVIIMVWGDYSFTRVTTLRGILQFLCFFAFESLPLSCVFFGVFQNLLVERLKLNVLWNINCICT